VSVCQVLTDGMGLEDWALLCLKDWELVCGIEALVFLGRSGLIRVDDHLDVFSSNFGYDPAHVDQVVLWVLRVNFL